MRGRIPPDLRGVRNLLFAFALISPFSAVAPPDLSECDAYERLSSDLGCPADGYLMKFGYKYCREFIQQDASFSEPGRATLAKIRSCLISSLQAKTELTCENVKARAEQDHVDCYLSSGFCELSSSDKMKLAEIVWDEFEDPAFAKVAETINERCGN